MGFRFSKRVTLLPGVRLNISKSGISTSIGPRGLSLTAGRNGIHLNAGIPGTGLSYRERLDRPANGQHSSGTTDSFSGRVTISLDDDGILSFLDERGNSVPSSVAKRVQIEQADAIESMLQAAADRHNCGLEACLGVHLQTPAPDARPAGLPDFDTPPPVEPRHEGVSILDKILLRGAEMERRQAQVQAEYQRDLLAWKQAKEAHQSLQAEVAKAFRLAQNGFAAGMESALAFVLSGIAWPKDTHVSYAFSYDQTALALDVDLPDEGDIPHTMAEVKPKRLVFKKRSDAQMRRDFVTLCHGSLVRAVGEAFVALPSIQTCVVSGYIQRPDAATGTINDEYILSAVIDRKQWSRIDFQRLNLLDPAACLQSFGARVALDRSSCFKVIEPFDLDAVTT